MIPEDVRENMHPSETITMLAVLFQDTNWVVRQTSIQAISALCQHSELLIPCKQHMLTIISEDVRANLKSSEIVTLLSGLLMDSDEDVRQTSIEAISAICQHRGLLISWGCTC
jgi:hypothetical protein